MIPPTHACFFARLQVTVLDLPMTFAVAQKLEATDAVHEGQEAQARERR